MSQSIRWGILGTGRIAGEFAQGLQHAPGGKLVAVGSRGQGTAQAFARQHGIARVHASYQSLVEDPEVDVIYVASPHSTHCEHTLMCLDAGKHVLCEKPLAVNLQEANLMMDRARQQECFLMEAMWMWFVPLIQEARKRIAQGVIGQVRMIQADFGFRVDLNPEARLFNPHLAGGALLDVGIYPIAFASLFLGPPQQIVSLPSICATGVDEQSAFVMRHSSGALSIGAAAIRTRTSQSAWIHGTEGSIHFPSTFWKAQHLQIIRENHPPEILSMPFDGNGYQFEALEVHQCLEAGMMESSLMTHEQSRSFMQIMDAMRGQWQMRYPMEQPSSR
jgi:predicted dehydrogenase